MRRCRSSVALVLAVSLVVGLLPFVVDLTFGTTPTASAAVPANIGPFPDCAGDDIESLNDDCLYVDDGIQVQASGVFGEGNTIDFTVSPDFPICPRYDQIADCVWFIDQPEIRGCTYLHEGDPTDPRSCGFSYANLYENTDGWPATSGERFTFESGFGTWRGADNPIQLRCTGRFNAVYVEGGVPPNDTWPILGEKVSDCDITVNLPRPTGLLGPSFVRIETSIQVCNESTFNCDGGFRTLRASAWVPVDGDLAPNANFEPIPAGGDGLRYTMRNTSIPFNDGATTYEWDFGDGNTATGFSPTHTFESMGPKFVRLTMRNEEGGRLLHTERIDLEPPDLSVIIYNPSAEFGPGKQGNRFSIGDVITVKVKVKATDGVGRLEDVTPIDQILTLPPQLQFAGDPIVVSPRDFRSGDSAEFDVPIRAVSPGRVTIATIWQGKDLTGAVAGPWRGQFNGSVTGLKVEILPDPDSFRRADTDGDGDVDADDENHVDVEVKVTNVTDEPIDDVTKGELVVTTKTDDVLPQFLLVSAPVDDPATTEIDESDFGDLAAGASKSLTWTYSATEALHVDVSMLVTGDAGGATVTGLGEGVVKAFDNVVLEAEIALGSNPSYLSGKGIRIDGVFTNVTDQPLAEEELTIGFAVSPKFSEAPGVLDDETLPLNGAGGYFGNGSRTTEGLEGFELEPGQSISLRAIVESLATDLPSGWTIEYTVGASIKRVSESGDVTWEPLDQLEIDVVEKDGFSADHTVKLGIVPEEREVTNLLSCDPDAMWTATYIGCKLVRGVETAARGFGELMLLGWDIATAPARMYGWVLGTSIEMLMQDDAGRAAIAAEIVDEMTQLKNSGVEILRNIDVSSIATAVPRMMDDGIRRLHNAWCGRTPERQAGRDEPCNGDAEVFMGELAEIAGENIDMVLEGLVAARSLAKISRALSAGDTGTATVLQRLWARRAERSLADADAVIATKGARAVPGARVLPAGVDVTSFPKIWRDAYGLSQKQFDALRRLTQEYTVNITFRSRAPRAASLIESGRALPKPQGIKTKGVNDLDVEFLGYADRHRDLVVHMEPPIPYNADYGDLGEVAEQYADQVLRSKRPGLDPGSPEFIDLRSQIKERVITRHDEWGDLSKDYWDALRTGEDGAPRGVQVDFDGKFNDEGGLKYERNREIELRRVEPGPNGRRVYEVKLQDPATGEFLDVTGDVDFLAILKPDGTVLGANGDPAEIARRTQLYELMRSEPISMQHGESFSIANRAETRAKYLRDGVDAPGGETTLTMTPGQRLITTFFDDSLSTLKVGRNTIAEFNEARAFFRGVFTELGTPDRAWSRQLLEQVVEARNLIRALPVLFNISLLDQFVVDLRGRVEEAFERDGQLIRPDGSGGVERYVPNASSSDAVSSLRATQRSTPASNVVVDELDQILSGLEASGFERDPAGALGGRWIPVDIEEVVGDGSLALAPFAFLTSGVSAGDRSLAVSTREQLQIDGASPWFEVGDRVVIDPGGSGEEVATVTSTAPLTLASPLTNSHNEATTVLLLPETAVDAVTAVTPLSPARLVDTRPGETTDDGRLAGGGAIVGGDSLRVPVRGRGGVPASATSVVVNTVAVSPSGPGFLSLYPCDDPVPRSSSVNYGARPVDVNGSVVKLSAGGEFCVFASATTHVVIDVNAYAEGDEALAPKRLAESRSGESTDDGLQAGFGRVAAGSVTEIQVAGRGGVPGGAAAVAVNVTAVFPSAPGFLTLYPCDAERPTASSLNHGAGVVRPNSAVVALSAAGTLCVYSLAETDLIVDVSAWFADVPSLVAVNPARLLETRPGEQTIDDESEGIGRLQAGSVTKVQVAGRGGVPNGATAAAINAAAIFPSGPGFVTLFPCDEDLPTASSMNYVPGDVIANSGVVKLAADGSVCLFTLAATDVILDVNAAWVN